MNQRSGQVWSEALMDIGAIFEVDDDSNRVGVDALNIEIVELRELVPFQILIVGGDDHQSDTLTQGCSMLKMLTPKRAWTRDAGVAAPERDRGQT